MSDVQRVPQVSAAKRKPV